MANVGTRITCNTTTLVTASSTIVGQGPNPELWCLYSTSDASSTSPTWTDATAKVRAFSISRGRESELAEIDAGSATLTLDNRDRTFDPTFNTAIRPLNRWWLREQFSGETQDMFVGYAESYDNQWDVRAPTDAVCTVQCADEFKVLALDKLPTTSPPRDSYNDLVMSDEPSGFWTFDDSTFDAAAGARLRLPSSTGYTIVNGTPIVGQEYVTDGDTAGGYISLASGQQVEAESTDAGDPMGINFMTIECWVRLDSVPADANVLLQGPKSTAASNCWFLSTDNTLLVSFGTYNGATFLVAPSAAGTVAVGTWYHLVGTIDNAFIRSYINGVQVGSAAWSGTVPTAITDSTGAPMTFNRASDAAGISLAKVAHWRGKALSASRIAAHYTAGTARGYTQQLPGARANAVLDTIANPAPRDIGTGTKTMQAVFMRGQDPLEELRRTARAEAPDGVLFVDKSGALTLLDSGHRFSSPYNTVQAVYGDGDGLGWTLGTSALDTTTELSSGTELPYTEINVDFSEAFLANDWNVTRTGRAAALQTAQDSASISAFRKRSQSVTDVPVTTNADAATIANAMLGKYKDVFERITSLSPNVADAATAVATFARDIGDRIQVIRTPPGGGSRIDQTLFIQKITVDASALSPVWRVTFGVSPL